MMSRFTIVGLFLSALALVLLVYLLYDCFARSEQRVATLRLGGLEIGKRKMRWIWAVVLVVGFAAGLFGYPVLELTDREHTRRGGSPMVQPASQVERIIRLPFWVSRTSRALSEEGRRISTTREERLQIPWIFLLTVGLYGFGVGGVGAVGTVGEEPAAEVAEGG